MSLIDRVRNSVEVDGEIYTKVSIKNMSREQVKMLISQCDEVKDVQKIAKFYDDVVIDDYVDHLIDKIAELNNKDW